jgi:hypothetical protein
VTIDDFRHLWEAQSEKYVLVKVEGGSGLVIFDPAARVAKLIDDDGLQLEVVERMVAAGCSVVDSVPRS